jgi:hypothetical protein
MLVKSLPAEAVRAGVGIPQVCARHGASATHWVRCTFRRVPPRWVGAGGLIPILTPVVVAAFLVRVLGKSVTSDGWPLCDACMTRHRRLWPAGWVSLGLGFLACVVPWLVLDPDGPVSSAEGTIFLTLFAAGAVGVVTGLVLTVVGAVASVAGGVTAADGTRVEFARAAPPFVQELYARRQPGGPVAKADGGR